MLILQSRIVGAFNSFDAQYNFLRFTDAKIIAPADQSIVRLQQDQTVFEALALLRGHGLRPFFHGLRPFFKWIK